jgi:MSHA pilin protein MshD
MSTRSRGVTLVELIVFMVIVGVAVAGLFAAFNTMTKGSADPQVRKQVLAIAESLMEEVQLMPLTYCDPDDPLAPTASGSSGCTGGLAGPNNEDKTVLAAETDEDRYGTILAFDNVSDYNGFSLPAPPGIKDINENPIAGLEGYSASIAVTRAGTALGLASDSDALLIAVTVTGPGSVQITLEGYRMRYAPNTVP